jgi:hypothetical protein
MVHIIFDPNSVNLNDFEQIGGGDITYFRGLPPYQRGYGYRQRGAGVGDVLRSLWRVLLPVFKTAGQTVGREALTTGNKILDNLAEGKDVKTSVKEAAKVSADNLLEKSGIGRQFGTGTIKRHRKSKNRRIINPVGRTVIKRKKTDAFGFY